ncbi:MAG TPA: hypothetical protein VMJ32_12875 [Pirellulales bacterium]|nr:hypothetical protein [Pirellulales bacterium]
MVTGTCTDGRNLAWHPQSIPSFLIFLVCWRPALTFCPGPTSRQHFSNGDNVTLLQEFIAANPGLDPVTNFSLFHDKYCQLCRRRAAPQPTPADLKLELSFTPGSNCTLDDNARLPWLFDRTGDSRKDVDRDGKLIIGEPKNS